MAKISLRWFFERPKKPWRRLDFPHRGSSRSMARAQELLPQRKHAERSLNVIMANGLLGADLSEDLIPCQIVPLNYSRRQRIYRPTCWFPKQSGRHRSWTAGDHSPFRSSLGPEYYSPPADITVTPAADRQHRGKEASGPSIAAAYKIHFPVSLSARLAGMPLSLGARSS